MDTGEGSGGDGRGSDTSFGRLSSRGDEIRQWGFRRDFIFFIAESLKADGKG